MLQRFFESQIRRAVHELGVPLDYMRDVARTSPSRAWRMGRFTRLAQFSSPVPAGLLHVAAITGSMVDDCGSCVQIGVNLAQQAGVAPEVIQAVLDRRTEDLSEELRDVYDFADMVTAGHDPGEELRGRIRDRWGEVGLIDLAMAVAMHRVYPSFKRALGHATACQRVTVGASSDEPAVQH